MNSQTATSSFPCLVESITPPPNDSLSTTLDSDYTISISSTSPRQPYEKVACVMVGLPARGKTYIAQKVCRYLNWLGISSKVFNVGTYRRKSCEGSDQSAAFFDPHNRGAEAQRNEAACHALSDMIAFLSPQNEIYAGGQVGIFDATNTTKERRKMLFDSLTAVNISVLFIESICESQELIQANIKEVKLSSPDYQHVTDEHKAMEDFNKRISHYQSIYKQLSADKGSSEAGYSFVKLIDIGAKCVINSVMQYMQSRIVFFLINLHIKPRSIFIVRHGESEFNRLGRIGGDAPLSERGRQFAAELPQVVRMVHEKQSGGSGCGGGTNIKPLTVWTSTLRRTKETARHMGPSYRRIAWKALDEIDAGECDGMTYEEIEDRFPEDFRLRDEDKFGFRYRGGESYADLVLRLEPIIMEAERTENVLIVGHQAVLRAILSYFLNKDHSELPYLKVPLHMLIQLTPRAYGCQVTYYKVGVDAVDTYREKPV